MKIRHRIKIIATIGPASSDREIIRELIRAGIDVVRLNFSHGRIGDHAANLEMVRQVAMEEERNIAILMDLQGPKIRVGELSKKSIELPTGKEITLAYKREDLNNYVIPVYYKYLNQDVRPGEKIYIDDGKIELRIESMDGEDVKCRVISGGVLKERKGINFPDTNLSIKPITDKDKVDLKFAIAHKADYIAMSFVRSAQDIRELKGLLGMEGSDIPVIAKLEKPEALEDLDEILSVSDGVMVARGDLGVEIRPERVPIFQKYIIEKANSKGKMVITATQMLESMINNALPTRAEATDIANAVLDGTDAVMLSGETAAGQYPVRSVEIMRSIIEETENSILYERAVKNHHPQMLDNIVDSICRACVEAVEQVKAKVIVVFTQSGFTAQSISKYRPPCSILALTPVESVYKQLALVWGISAYVTEKKLTLEEVIEEAEQRVKEYGLARKGDTIAILCGIPLRAAGITNLLKLQRL